MNRLNLVPLPGEASKSPTERMLKIGVGDVSYGCAIAERVCRQGLFTSVHVLDVVEDLCQTVIGKPRLTRDNPFLKVGQINRLDEHGLIRTGVRVVTNEVLASILVADPRPARRERRRPDKGMQWVTDRSIYVSREWQDAVVESVRRLRGKELGRRPPQGLLERVEIVLHAERPLQIGDILLIDGRPTVLTSFISAPPQDRLGVEPDIVVSSEFTASLRILPERCVQLPVAKTEERAAEALQARGTGPYSLITEAPLVRRPYGGQTVTAAHVAWLQERNLTGLIGEFTSLKSDDLVHRSRLAALANEPAGTVIELDEPAAPLSLAEIAACLLALGLKVELTGSDGHVTLGVRPATASQIAACSAGEIRKPETIDYRTYDDVDDGLFAPNVFGPSNGRRRRRFGHIMLAAPIIPYLWRIGSPSLITRLTGLNDDEVERIAKYQATVVWHDDGPRLIDRSPEEQRPDSQPSEENLGSGAAAIQAIIDRKAGGHLPNCDVTTWTTDSLAVLPPDWRPLVLLDSGNFATSDLNDLYRQVINRNNRLRKLMELNAPAVIIDSESRQLQVAVDALFANHLLPEADRALGSAGRPLVDLLLMMSNRIVQDLKRVDWSGAARLIPSAGVSAAEVLVPQAVFETLRLNEELPLLLTSPEGRIVARLPRRHDEAVLSVSESTYQELSVPDSCATVIQFHRPVTTAGREEAYRILNGKASVSTTGSVATPAWIDGDDFEELAEKLVAAAIDSSPIALSSPRGLLLGGVGSIQFAEDGEPSGASASPRQVPIPTEDQVQFSEPTFDQMLAVARANAKKTCIFDVSNTDQPPPAAAGRIGGEPYLPPEIEWPRFRDKPLPFLGQFPLDPARDAGVLPMDVPPKSMLSVFGGDECWEYGPCHPRCRVFVHSIENLIARPIPSDLKCPVGLCQITPRVIEEIPDWFELCEILQWELGNPKRTLLKEFQERHLPEMTTAAEAIKIGGWSKWIQDYSITEPLLIQIASLVEADLTFGDGGVLYIFVESGEFTCFAQCY